MRLLVAVGVALIVVGALDAVNNMPSPSDPNPGQAIAIGGIIMFFVCWLVLSALAVRLYQATGLLELEKKVRKFRRNLSALS